jgi:twitching motility protein PilT
MLKDIDFKDIYLGEKHARLAGVPGTSDPIPAPLDCEVELSEIRSMCQQKMKETLREEFPIRHKNVTYRVSVLTSIEDTVFVLRRFPSKTPHLTELSIHKGYVEYFMKPGITGLICIAGAYRQGKTTTASSIISSRLNHFGGVGITIEDPPEMPLEGEHGEGVCYQTWAEGGEFADACRKMARFAPSIIFLGEVRDSETAVEVLKASINGSLVVCTIHADSATSGVERLFTLASSAIGNPEETASLLAGGLLCVMHQALEGELVKHPKLQMLWLGDEEESQGARSNIRSRKFEQLNNVITYQLNKLLIRGSSDAEVARV